MTEYCRITGLNNILFDTLADPRFLPQLRPPKGHSSPLLRQEVIAALPRLPLDVRPQALNRGLSVMTMEVAVRADTDIEMEQAIHEIHETLRDTELYFSTQGARGSRAEFLLKSDGAMETSYKSIYYGELDEGAARQILGGQIKAHQIEGMVLTLYCEPYWRPDAAIQLGPNEVYCPGFEEDGDANGRADNWTAYGAPVLSMESTIVLQGFYSQQADTNAANEGVYSANMIAPGGTTQAVAYAWICRPAAGTNITVALRDNTAGVNRATAAYDTAGWDTAPAKDGVNTFKRVEVSSGAIVAGNTHILRIYSNQATVSTWYADKAYWKWGTTTVPDEWCDHWNLYNHYDTTEGAAHVGHQNYFDVADLKGTNDTRLRLNVEQNTRADYSYYASLVMGRRSWWTGAELTPVRDVHWIEAEDAYSRSNWANAVLARCSAGNCVSDAANAAGYVQWLATYVGPTGYRPWHWNTRWDVYGMALTDNAADTMYRLSYTGLGENPWYYNPWVRQVTDSEWQMTYLGSVNFDRFVSAPYNPASYYIRVEYAKTAIDTAQLDCVWMIPSHEPRMRLQVSTPPWLTTSYAWFYDRTEDFNAEWAEFWDLYLQGAIVRQGNEMTFVPQTDNRLYLSAESVNPAPAPDAIIWEAHGGATNLQFTVSAGYMPQYRSPLD